MEQILGYHLSNTESQGSLQQNEENNADKQVKQ